MKLKIPTYEFLIDDSQESGVKTISIVSDPAFGSKAVFFEQQKPVFISLADKKKQIVCGLSLIPNVLVYRIDGETGEEYNGFFSAETIEKIVNKFHDEQQGKNVNLEHNSNLPVNAYLLEDYIVNTDSRVADLKAIGIEHPNIFGAWYTAYKVKDPEVFNTIINGGDSVGFSVESFLDKVLTNFNKDIKNKLITNIKKSEMTKINKSLKEKILAIFTEVEKFKRALVPELAFEIEYNKPGEPVNKVIVDANGNETLQPVGEGTFSTDAGIIVVDATSNLVEIRDLPAQPAVEKPEVSATSGSTSGITTGQTTIVSGSTEIVGDQSAPKIQVPEVSGTTSGSTKTTSTPLASGVTSGDTHTTGTTTVTPSGSTTPASSDGLNKTIKELCPVAGDYMIQVCVDDQGNVTEATVSSMKDLMPQASEGQPGMPGMDGGFATVVKKAFARIVELEAKMKEPISDPILAPEKKVLSQDEFDKLTPFEKIKYNRGW